MNTVLGSVWRAALLSLSAAALYAQTCSPQTPQYCPGAKNPIAKPGDAAIFPIGGLLQLAPGAPNSSTYGFYNFVAEQNQQQMQLVPKPATIPFQSNLSYVATSGRIIAPGANSSSATKGYPQDVVYAWRSGTNVQVSFMNPDHAQYDLALGTDPNGYQIAPKVDSDTYGVTNDFITVASGDLDGAIDANGETHDEVVVAYPAQDSQGTWVVDLFVLNYSDATGKPATASATTPAGICGTGCFATTSNLANTAQPTVLLSGNVLSLAIGDFDGDGANEIALAQVANSQTIYVHLFRYRNSGNPSTAQLAYVTSYTAPLATSMATVGSVSLVSGDFNNDGKDELALGYANWQKFSTTPPGGAGEYADCVIFYAPEPQKGLIKQTCDYAGYGVLYNNYVSVIRGGLTTASATVTGSSHGTTVLRSTNAAAKIPSNVVIYNASGDWSALNGVWPTTIIDANTFSIPVDSSSFTGTAPTVQVTNTADFSPGGTDSISPRVDNPGGYNLPSIVDFRDAHSRPTIQLQSGLFQFDATNPGTFHQRQFLALFNTPSPADVKTLNQADSPIGYWAYDLVGSFYTVSTDGNDKLTRQNTTSLPESHNSAGKYGYPHNRFSLAASNFFPLPANQSADYNPSWWFGIGEWLDAGGYRLRIGSIQQSKFNILQDINVASDPVNGSYWSGVPLVPYDKDGTSYFLGAPIHAQVSNYPTIGYILQEPPKHLLWDSSQNQIHNISRSSATKSSVTIETSQSSATTAQTSSSYDVATSASLSGEVSLSEGNAELVGAEVSASDKASVSYDYNASKSALNSQTGTVEYNIQGSSPNDDYLEYTESNFDIWRYRIYGMTSSSPTTPYQYYEIVVPGAPFTSYTSGLNADWYSPDHENGNILSYPANVPGALPADVSPNAYQVNGITPPGLSNGLMWTSTGYCFGSVQGGMNMTITGTSGKTDTITTSNTMKEDNEVNLGEKTNFFGLKTSASFDLNFGSNQSWGKATTSTNQTSSATSFAFNLDQGTASYGYVIAPTLYQSLSGAIKMGYTVSVPSEQNSTCGNVAGETWTGLYSKPDPALALPFRFDYITDNPSQGTVYQLHSGHDREQLKSFFLENPTPNPVESVSSTVYDKLSSVSAPGDTVQLAVRVYNYSVAQAAANIGVQFSIIPVSDPQIDPAGDLDNEYGCGATASNNSWVCPNSYRTPIKSVVISSIPAWNTDPNAPNWTIARTTWTVPSTLAPGKYRVYVNLSYSGTEANPPQQACTQIPCPALCPPNQTSCDAPAANTDPNAPGQNNEGWAYITIGSQLTAPGGLKDVYTSDDSLAVISQSCVWEDWALGFTQHALKLRVKALANLPEERYRRMVVTDKSHRRGEPNVIADKFLQGVTTDGATAFFMWRPSTPGVHHLNAEVKEFADDIRKGNNTASLNALIIRAPGDINGDGVIDSQDLSFIEGETGKPTAFSRCGYACDLNGDGRITRVDQDLLLSLCTHDHCASGGKARSSFRDIEQLNRDELTSVVRLRRSDWATLMRQTKDMDRSGITERYFIGFWRASAVRGR